MTNKESFSNIVTTEWLNRHLNDEDLLIIDATVFFRNPNGEFLASGKDQYDEKHIPGAVFVDLFEVNEPDADIPFTVRESPKEFKAYMEHIGMSDDTYVVIYDSGAEVEPDYAASIWASRLAWQLNFEGKDRVAVLEGGLPKWEAEGRSVDAEIPEKPLGSLTIQRRPELYANIKQVENGITRPDTIIIDTLTRDQYNGKKAPFGEDRAGHIPSAKNVFYGGLADPETGELLEDRTIAEKFIEYGALASGTRVIVYCGFGIGATWVWLLLNKLGQQEVAVFDGSLQEWAEDTSRPLEV